MPPINHLLEIIQTAIRSVRPAILFSDLLNSHPQISEWHNAPRRYLLCVGKAAADSAIAILKQVKCEDYLVIAPMGVATDDLDAKRIILSSHPVPDLQSHKAGQTALQWIGSLPAESRLLVIISGGSSALMVTPFPPITLDEKRAVNDLLIRSGASIHEINAVRKHISAVKGGRLGEACAHVNARVLAISDVIGNDFSTIGSGPFFPDKTTFANAKEVLLRFGIWDSTPPSVRKHIEKGLLGDISETPKELLREIPHTVIASNEMSRQIAAEQARLLGYEPVVHAEAISMDVEKTAVMLREVLAEAKPKHALICGGEITVQVPKNSGKGGRNQHLALLMAQKIAGHPVIFAAAGTDGIDGNSPSAGAWVDGDTLQNAAARGLNYEEALKGFDSFHFFQALGQTIESGPSGTNVMDLYIALT